VSSSRGRAVGRAAVMLAGILLLAACGASEDPPTQGTGATPGPSTVSDGAAGGGVGGACDLTEPAEVAEVFGGTVGSEEPGIARNCTYAVQGPNGTTVAVYYYGDRAIWSGMKSGYADNRGPLTDVAGVGDEAFHPNDAGPLELVVLAGDVAFAVGIVDGKGTAAQVKELAKRIATSRG
jgi:hypothetical protein